MWEQHIQELKDFQQQHGHCRVPKDDEDYKDLSTWIHRLRSSFARLQRGEEADISLTEERITELKRIGLRLSLVNSKAKWKRRLKELIEFRRVHGNFQVPRNCQEFPHLSSWLAKLCITYNKRKRGEDISILMDSQLSKLEKIGYDFENGKQHFNLRESKEKGIGKRRELRALGLDRYDARWNQRVQELKKFKEEHGHFNVVGNTGTYDALYNWIRNNHHHYSLLQKGEKSTRLTSERISQLRAIGFDFVDFGASVSKRQSKSWNERVQELKDFKGTHGHFNVPINVERYTSLGNWMKSNQTAYNKFLQGEGDRLTTERVDQLKDIGFRFDYTARRQPAANGPSGPNCHNARWNQRVKELKKFNDAHGHFNVPFNVDKYKALANWMFNNRQHYNNLRKGVKSSRLTNERLIQLMEIGFNFNQSTQRKPDSADINVPSCPIARWNHRVQELEDFHEEHGHFEVPSNTEADRPLSNWLENNQTEYNKIKKGIKSSRLTDERIAQLGSIGFNFVDKRRKRDKEWDEALNKLKKYEETNGHFNIPSDDEDHQSLRLWMAKNQEEHNKLTEGGKSSHLTPTRLRQFRHIGFHFESTPTRASLDSSDPKSASEEDVLTERRPDSVGIKVPSCPIAQWNQRIAELLDFRKEHGHFKVRKNGKGNRPLSNWLENIRTEYKSIQKGTKSSRLTDQRIAELESIGFYFVDKRNWDLEWDKHLNELKEYKDALGHFDVPSDDEDYQSLRLWMAKNQKAHNRIVQGEEKKSTHLTPGRLRQLRDIGFRFKCTATPKESTPKDTIMEYDEESLQGGSLDSSASDSGEEEVEVKYLGKHDGNSSSQATSPSVPGLARARYDDGVLERGCVTVDTSSQQELQKFALSQNCTPVLLLEPANEAVPARARAPVDEPPKEKSHKVSTSPSTSSANQALLPPFLLGLDSMMVEMNRVELEHEKNSKIQRNVGKPNLFWLDIGDRDGIEFF